MWSSVAASSANDRKTDIRLIRVYEYKLWSSSQSMPPADGRPACTCQSLTEARAKAWQAALVAKVLSFVPEAPARRTRLPASVEEVISPYWDPARSKIEPCRPVHFA